MKSTQIKYLLRFAGLHISHQSVPLEMYIDVYLLILTKLFITITSCSMNIMLLISYTFQQHKCYFLFRYWVCLVEHEYGHTHIYIHTRRGEANSTSKSWKWLIVLGRALNKVIFCCYFEMFFFFVAKKYLLLLVNVMNICESILYYFLEWNLMCDMGPRVG